MKLRNLGWAGLVALSLAAVACGGSTSASDGTQQTDEGALSDAVPSGSAAVTTGDVNLRSGPSVTFSVVRPLTAGTALTITDGSPDNDFYRVQTNDGASGFVFGPYLRVTGSSSNSSSTSTTDEGDSVGDANGEVFHARGTGYFPDNSAMEGGFKDRKGLPLHTLQDFLERGAEYVSVAMDPRAFPYGQKLRIKEIEAKYGRAIDFRVVDTGGAFMGKGRTRIDICTANNAASLDPAINEMLTLTIIE